ncbi:MULTISPECIES: hypothetical protein [Listeria]|uniref:hypothetical protein n=1 Tax=Listeria TaxID=1637 RepID=UPI000B58F2BF|nr:MULTISPECIES: hypothetical protein [Listeria]
MFTNQNYIKKCRIHKNNADIYPFNIPSIQKTEELVFDENITFFVGGNGMGKSTLFRSDGG